VFHHEFTHLIQVITTPVGYQWLFLNSAIHKSIQEILREDPRVARKPLAKLRPQDGTTDRQREMIASLTKRLKEADVLWQGAPQHDHFASQSLKGQRPKVIIDRSARSISVEGIGTVPVTMPTILEFLARCCEYGSRDQAYNRDRQNLLFDDGGRYRAIDDTLIESDEIVSISGFKNILYDWPAIYAESKEIYPLNAYIYHMIIASWICLFAPAGGASPDDAIDYFLLMCDYSPSEIVKNYFVFRDNLDSVEGVKLTFSPFKLGDRYCKYGLRPTLSQCVSNHLSTIEKVRASEYQVGGKGLGVVQACLIEDGAQILGQWLENSLKMYVPFAPAPGTVFKSGPIVQDGSRTLLLSENGLAAYYLILSLQKEALISSVHHAYFENGLWSADGVCALGEFCSDSKAVPDGYFHSLWEQCWQPVRSL